MSVDSSWLSSYVLQPCCSVPGNFPIHTQLSCFALIQGAWVTIIRCAVRRRSDVCKNTSGDGYVCIPFPRSYLLLQTWKGSVSSLVGNVNDLYGRSVLFEKWDVRFLTHGALAGKCGLAQTMGCGNVLLFCEHQMKFSNNIGLAKVFTFLPPYSGSSSA